MRDATDLFSGIMKATFVHDDYNLGERIQHTMKYHIPYTYKNYDNAILRCMKAYDPSITALMDKLLLDTIIEEERSATIITLVKRRQGSMAATCQGIFDAMVYMLSHPNIHIMPVVCLAGSVVKIAVILRDYRRETITSYKDVKFIAEILHTFDISKRDAMGQFICIFTNILDFIKDPDVLVMEPNRLSVYDLNFTTLQRLEESDIDMESEGTEQLDKTSTNIYDILRYLDWTHRTKRIKEYIGGKGIYKASNSRIIHMRLNDSNEPIVGKILSAYDNNAVREILLDNMLDGHPCGPSLIDYFYDEDRSHIYIIYPLLKPCRPNGLQNVMQYAKRLLISLKQLHENNIIHHDIKRSNIMVRDRGNDFDVVLIDLGSSRIIPEGLRYYNGFGTRGYRPQDNYLTTKIDLFATGIVIAKWMIRYTGLYKHIKTPSKELDRDAIMSIIESDDETALLRVFAQFYEGCLAESADDRFDVNEALKSYGKCLRKWKKIN